MPHRSRTLIGLFHGSISTALLNLHRFIRILASSNLEANMSFEPKYKVNLDPPKDDPISPEYLAKCDGSCSSYLPPKTCCNVLMVVNRNQLRLPDICGDQSQSREHIRKNYPIIDDVAGHCFRCERQQSIRTRRILQRYWLRLERLTTLQN